MMLTVEDVCERLDCPKHHVYRLIARGELPAHKSPGRTGALRVDEHALNAYQAARTGTRGVSVADICERLQCGGAKVYRLIAAGHLPARKGPGRTGGFRVSEADLDAYLERTRVSASPPLEGARRGRQIRATA